VVRRTIKLGDIDTSLSAPRSLIASMSIVAATAPIS